MINDDDGDGGAGDEEEKYLRRYTIQKLDAMQARALASNVVIVLDANDLMGGVVGADEMLNEWVQNDDQLMMEPHDVMPLHACVEK